MSTVSENINQAKAADAFSKQSVLFDKQYGSDAIIKYKRQRVREHILQFAKPYGSMLELNCGTGEDAMYFASKGFAVHATDVSTGMLSMLNKKIETCKKCVCYLNLPPYKNL